MRLQSTISFALLAILLLPSCKTITTGKRPPLYVKTLKTSSKEVIRETIILRSSILDGKKSDGTYRRLVAHHTLGDGSQREGQKPLISVRGSGTVQNLVIDFPAADGIHVYPDPGKTITIRNVQFWDVGEDAITVKSGDGSSKVNILDCRFGYATDKIVQVNAPAKVLIDRAWVKDSQKLARSNGTLETNLPYNITVDDSVMHGGLNMLKMSNSKARGLLSDSFALGVRKPAEASNGASIKIRNLKTN